MTAITTNTTTLFVFNHPAPEALEEMPLDYYGECQIAGAGSVEIQLDADHTEIISATRYVPVGVGVAAAVVEGVLQVFCTVAGREPILLREFADWSSYTVRRPNR
ncbi:hypothetical protein LIX17_26155 (plasmid) [Mycobacterium avium subsp. hominissuis]|uniref:hypothetical protein n=1 Tax=Mycobacterium avium TaxID=1764 RepID=UPI00313FE7A1